MKGEMSDLFLQVRVWINHLGSLFADTGVSPSNDDDLPGQVRNVVDGELGLWSKVTFDKNRVERSYEDAEGGGDARARHG